MNSMFNEIRADGLIEGLIEGITQRKLDTIARKTTAEVIDKLMTGVSNDAADSISKVKVEDIIKEVTERIVCEVTEWKTEESTKMRDELLVKFISVFRQRGNSDDEIKSLLLKNFQISSDEVDSYLTSVW